MVSASRPLALAGVTALVLIVALVAGMSLRERGRTASPSPAASATPEATASATHRASTASPTATSAPSPSPSPTPGPAAAATVLDERFGFFYYPRSARPPSKAIVRSETSAAEVSSFSPQDRSFVSVSRAVSPDGRSVAYWGPISEGAVLHVRAVGGGSDRPVFTAARAMSGGAFAWSSDGTGLAVAVDNNCFEFCPGPSVGELWTVDLASGASERIASGRIWLPVAWDRAAKLVAAGTSGPGGYLVSFDVISLSAQPYEVRSTGYRQPLCCALGLRASADARYALLTWPGIDAEWWPIGEPAQRSTIPSSASRALWRPGTSEIWWVGGLGPPGCQFACRGSELVAFDVVNGVRRVVAQGTFGGTIVGFRVDGSAAITDDGSTRQLVFVDIATGRTATTAASGEFVESVRLR